MDHRKIGSERDVDGCGLVSCMLVGCVGSIAEPAEFYYLSFVVKIAYSC
jgi:hypothetical protein